MVLFILSKAWLTASRESPRFFSKTCLWARSKWACKSLYPLPLSLLNLQSDMRHGFSYGRSSVQWPFMFWITSAFFASSFWKRVTLAVQRAFLYFRALGETNVVLESSRHQPHSKQNLSWSSPPSICPRRTWIKDQRCVGYSENWQPPCQEWCLHWENGKSFADQLIKCIVAATCLLTFEP